jgi:hypothetical protein
MDDQQQHGFQWIERTLIEMAVTKGVAIDRIFCEPAPRGGFVIVAYVNCARHVMDVPAAQLRDLFTDESSDLQQVRAELWKRFFETADPKT